MNWNVVKKTVIVRNPFEKNQKEINHKNHIICRRKRTTTYIFKDIYGYKKYILQSYLCRHHYPFKAQLSLENWTVLRKLKLFFYSVQFTTIYKVAILLVHGRRTHLSGLVPLRCAIELKEIELGSYHHVFNKALLQNVA